MNKANQTFLLKLAVHLLQKILWCDPEVKGVELVKTSLTRLDGIVAAGGRVFPGSGSFPVFVKNFK